MTATFFKKIPRIQYKFKTKDGIETHDMVNISIRYSLDIDSAIKNGQTFRGAWPSGTRPETFAEKFYGMDELYWVSLMTGGIFDIHNELPYTSEQFYEYLDRKYSYSPLYREWAHRQNKPRNIDSLLEYLSLQIAEIQDISGDLVHPAHVKDDDMVKLVTLFQKELKENQDREKINILNANYAGQLRIAHTKAMNDLLAELE